MAALSLRIRSKMLAVAAVLIASNLVLVSANAEDTIPTLIREIDQNGMSAIGDRLKGAFVDGVKETLPAKPVALVEKLHSLVSFMMPTGEDGLAVAEQGAATFTFREELDSELVRRAQSRYFDSTAEQSVELFKANAPRVISDALEAADTGTKDILWMANKGWQFVDYAKEKGAALKQYAQEVKATIKEEFNSLVRALGQPTNAAKDDESDTSPAQLVEQSAVAPPEASPASEAALPPARPNPFTLQAQSAQPTETAPAGEQQSPPSARPNPFTLKAQAVEQKISPAEKKLLLSSIRADLRKSGISAKILDDDVTPLDYRVHMVQLLADLNSWAEKETARKEALRLRLLEIQREERERKEEDARIARQEAEYEEEKWQAKRAARRAKLDRERDRRDKRRERQCRNSGICVQSRDEIVAQIQAINQANHAQLAAYHQQMVMATNNYLRPPNAYPPNRAVPPDGIQMSSYPPSNVQTASTPMTSSATWPSSPSSLPPGPSSAYSQSASNPYSAPTFSSSSQANSSPSYGTPPAPYSTPSASSYADSVSSGPAWYDSNYSLSNWTTQSPAYEVSRCTPPTYTEDEDLRESYRRARIVFENCLKHLRDVSKSSRRQPTTADRVFDALNPRPASTTTKRPASSSQDQKRSSGDSK